MRALVTRGTVKPEAAALLGAALPEHGRRYGEIVFVVGDGASPADAVMGLKDAIAVAERKPPAKILILVAPEVIEDMALAAFAAVKSIARETAMPANCVNALWLKPGKLPGWRAPIDLWAEAARLVPALFQTESTTGQVFILGPAATAVPL